MRKKSKNPRRKEKRVMMIKNGKNISKPKAQGSLEEFIEKEEVNDTI